MILVTVTVIDEPIKAVEVVDKSQANKEIYSVPIIVIPGKYICFVCVKKKISRSYQML